MHPALLYLFKLSVSLAVVFLFYQLVLRRLTFFNWNRWYLLGYTLICFFVPLVDISVVLEENKLSDSSIINWVPLIRSSGEQIDTGRTASITTEQAILLLILAGMVIMLIRLLIQFISFRRMMRKATYISGTAMQLYQVDENIIPFSFGNAVFLNKHLHTEEELQEIIRHEFIHVKQRHSADILWSELLCLVNWYNPFAWLLKKAIRQNLEFIADDKVLECGINKKEYQYLLLKVTGNNQYSIATPFNFSSLKKRIAMMNKLKSAKVNLLRFLFILPLLAVILLSFRNKIGAQLNGKQKDVIQLPVTNFTDTVPDVKDTNSKGYFIDIKGKDGNCIVVVKDKSRKEVKQLLLTDWNAKAEYYEGLYGEIPPPPPPAPPAPPAGVIVEERPIAPASPLAPIEVVGVPVPPAPPVPAKLPADVSSISIQNEKAVVKRKNGTVEKYDFTDKEQKKKFENKYGQLPAPPAAPLAPVLEERRISPSNAPLEPVTVVGQKIAAVNAPGKLPDNVLYVIDNKIASANEVKNLNSNLIKTVNILKNENAIARYGEAGKNGVVEVYTKITGQVNANKVVEVRLSENKNVNTAVRTEVNYNASNDKKVDLDGKLIILDGKEITTEEMNRIPPASIESVNILKGKDATGIYGDKGKNGVIIIKSKKKLDVKPVTGTQFWQQKKDEC